MITRRMMLKGGTAAAAAVGAAALSGCGTILYPNRRGQSRGRIDVGVALLDALGLLFFIIPGVIAFAVDFSTGAIYLPHSRHASNEDPKQLAHDLSRVNPKDLTHKQRRIIHAVIQRMKRRGRMPKNGELRLAGQRVRVLALNRNALKPGTRLAMNG